MMGKKMQVSAMCLLLLHVAHSEVCSDGVCASNDLKQLSLDDAEMGESKELSMVQLSAIEKRAQEEEAGSAQALDAAVSKKNSKESAPEAPQKQSLKSKESKDQALHDTASKGKSSKDKASTDKSSKDKDSTEKSSKDKASTEQSSKDKSSKDKASTDKASQKISKEAAKKIKKIEEMAKADPWTVMGDGCCAGERDSANGKLLGENVSSLDECKAKCRGFNNCGIVEYGWKDMPQWCYAWGNTQACKKRDTECTKSVPGHGKGVKGYKFTAPKVTVQDSAEFSWDVVGPGCCDGLRDEDNGKLYASKEPTLDACKARCLTFANCGIIEYGWTTGDPEWCFIWDKSQKCEKQDLTCSKSAMGDGFGATAHKFIRAEE